MYPGNKPGNDIDNIIETTKSASSSNSELCWQRALLLRITTQDLSIDETGKTLSAIKKIRRNFVKFKIENINYRDIFILSGSGLISIPHHYLMFDMKLVVLRTIQLNSWSSSELSSVRLLRDRCTVRLGRAEWGCPQWLKEIDRAKYGDSGAASWFEMLHQFNKVLVVTKIFNPDITILICIQLSPSFLRFHNKSECRQRQEMWGCCCCCYK